MKFGEISGSLTNLNDGTSYLIAGTNINIVSESGGAVTISSTAGGGTSPANPDESVQFNDGGSFGGSANFTFSDTAPVRLHLTGAFAQGTTTFTVGQYSHAEGNTTVAEGFASHTEGYQTLAQTDYAHAEGVQTVAYAMASHAEGLGTIASGSYQHVQGKYNKRDNTFSLMVVGNGTSDDNADRSDVIRVNPGIVGDGRVEVTGSLAATMGLSGSLTKLVDGTSYLIAGTNVTISSQSNGAVTISAAGGGGTDSFFSSTVAGSIFTTGSTAFAGQESIDSPLDKGTDVFFYVSGSITGSGISDKKSLFGGDLAVSGSVFTHTFYGGAEEVLQPGPGDAIKISVMHHTTIIRTQAGTPPTATLDDGIKLGQIKCIVLYSYVEPVPITPNSLIGYSTITLNSDGDSVLLVWTTAGWAILSIYGATVT